MIPWWSFFTAEAPSPESVLVAIHALGFNVTHLGGLIEAYRLAVINDWNLQWENRTAEDKVTLKAPQGVRYHVLEGIDVVNPETILPAP